MQNNMFKVSKAIIGAFEKMIKANIIVEGLENIPPGPCLFVVNHFTRMETFLVPYVLYKNKGMMVHSLASSTLFHGMFGKYLATMGTIPKQAPGRNRMIIHDLLTGDANWVIYPEGMMVKNKHIFEKGRYRLNSPSWQGPPHTGAAVLAIKAEIIRQDCMTAIAAGKPELVQDHENRYQFSLAKDFSPTGSVMVPVNITYYPLRPGENFISDIAGLFFKDLPARVEEELKTEGKILLSNSDINIYFGEPIEIMPEVETTVNLGRKYFPFVTKKRRDDLITGFKRKKLTQEAMRRIYTSTAIHIDHLFCTALRKIKKTKVHRKDFSRALYLSALEVGIIEQRRTHPTLERDLIKCIVDEDYSPLESICKLTESVGALRREGEDYYINKEGIMGDDFPFHDIRIKNAAVVIANELEPLKKIVSMISRNINMPVETLKLHLAETLHKRNVKEFHADYEKYYDDTLSKDPSVGEPIFLHSKGNTSGIVLAHGYLAAPEEMRPLAEYLFSHGYSVYVPCLRGMGTAPRHIQDVTCDDWMYSFDKAYAVIRNSCRDVYAGGFSAGSLLVLLAAAKKKDAIKALFVINTPLLLQNIRNSFAPGIVTWNDFIKKLHLGELKRMEYIENATESPEVNYTQNYTKGVLELKRLIRRCRLNLRNIISPLLVIQGKEDPVVKPKSADLVYNKTSSFRKELEMMSFTNHVIIRKKGKEKVFERVLKFLDDQSEKPTRKSLPHT